MCYRKLLVFKKRFFGPLIGGKIVYTECQNAAQGNRTRGRSPKSPCQSRRRGTGRNNFPVESRQALRHIQSNRATPPPERSIFFLSY